MNDKENKTNLYIFNSPIRSTVKQLINQMIVRDMETLDKEMKALEKEITEKTDNLSALDKLAMR